MAAPAKLNQDMILQEAIAILREDGLDEVTLRKLAARLNVEAPSLYRHIGGKSRLQSMMLVEMFRLQIDEIVKAPTWQEWVLSLGRVFWSTQSNIKDCARLVLTTQMEPEQLAAMSEWAIRSLSTYGIDRETALEMQLTLQSLVLGMGGMADGPNAAYLRDSIPYDRIMERSLTALVTGWEARFAESGISLLPAASAQATRETSTTC